MTISQTAASVASPSSGDATSVLITVSTPGAVTPICRLGNSGSILGDFTVRELIEKVVSPKSLFSVGIPMSQLEAESPTALAITELLAADACEVLLCGADGEPSRPVALGERARDVAAAQTGASGSSFLGLALDLRPVADNAAPGGEERRQIALPETLEAETPAAPSGEPFDIPTIEFGEVPGSPGNGEPAPGPGAPAAAPSGPSIVAIVAEQPPKRGRMAGGGERKEYVRKSDWLRAQFQPEVAALNLTGLFVGNLGLGIREEQGRRQVVLADPSRITDILLRGNGYRRSGDHAKALICYQELMDMDPANADFRFLLGKTLLELGQHDQAVEALARAKELGHEGAAKELVGLKRSGVKARRPLGFLRFWKQ